MKRLDAFLFDSIQYLQALQEISKSIIGKW